MAVSVSPVNDNSIVGRFETPVSHKKFGHGRFQMVQGPSLVFAPRDPIDQGPGRFNKDLDIGQFVFDGLETSYGTAKLNPFPGIPDTFIQAIRHSADKRRH